jgi:hypothetical protein
MLRGALQTEDLQTEEKPMQFRGWMLSGALSILLAVPASAGWVVPVPTFSIVLTKTVGVAPGCATTDNIEVPAGTSVNYCYQVQNTGTATLDSHTLVDDVLGVLVGPNEMDDLTPGEVRTEIFPFVVNVTTTNTATWTAMSSTIITYTAGANGPVTTATAMDSATVNVPETDDACDDGLDNDGDLIIDCADSDCAGAAVCRAQAPVVGSTGLFVVAVLLLIIGNMALVSRRRRS